MPGHLFSPRGEKPAGFTDDIGPRLPGDKVEPAIHDLTISGEISRRGDKIGEARMGGPAVDESVLAQEQAAMLQHGPLEPSLGAPHDLVPTASLAGGVD